MKKILPLLLLLFLLSGCGKADELQAEVDSLSAALADESAALESAEKKLDGAQAALEECRGQLEETLAELEAAEEQLAALPEMDFGECCRMVYAAHTQRMDELVYYNFLSQDLDVIFSDYEGGQSQCLSSLTGTVIGHSTNSVYYWKAPDEYTSPEEAARELVGMMLEELKAWPDKGYTLLNYTVNDMELLDKYDLLLGEMRLVWENALYTADHQKKPVSRQVVEDYINDLFPVRMDHGGYGFRCDTIGYALGEDMWIFVPSFTYSFTGKAAGAEQGWIENGTNVDAHFRESHSSYFILIKNGDVWRMQSHDGIEALEAALLAQQ